MVDALVSFVVHRLGEYLIREAFSFHGGVTSEVVSLKKELEWMQCFVKYAEKKQVDNAMIKKFVSDIRDIAYDTEDVLDTFMLDFHDKSPSGIRQLLFTSITKFFGLFVTEPSLYNCGSENVNRNSISKEIAMLRKRIDDISRMHESYGIEKNIGKNWECTNREGRCHDLEILRQLKKATSFAVEENVVGFEDDASKLLVKLLAETPNRSVISILGMGGLGKTSFAGKLYHHCDVKKKFDCCAWVCVSQDYKVRDLLSRIVKSFKMRVTIEELERMREEDLERYLHSFLQGRTYLLVIDDVWKKEVWQSLKRAFPDNKNSSVLITTRIKDVAERSEDKTHVHKLRFLRPDESWTLFRQKAFGDSDVDQGLETLGREMVEKCGGLPLAIVVLGGLLSVKKPQEWVVVRDHIWQHLRSDSIEISYLLTLSFNDLSYQLKLCFLYLGLFPEDFEISTEKLIRQWVAEGFIVQDEDRIMEDVAMDNLEELIDRSLIQVEGRYHGRVVTCRVHDLLRDLIIQMAKELNFIHTIDESSHSSCSSNTSSCRRKAVYFDMERCMWLQHCNRRSRSLLLFIPDWYSFKELSSPICTRFSLLRVLHVESCRGSFGSKGLPKEIGQLIHLKYLALRNTGIRNLPPSFVYLRSLQTLDLHSFNCDLTLPNKIYKLQELRHLIASIKGCLPIENLTKLQTLKYVKYESWIKINPDRLVNLRELNIDSYVRRGHKSFVFNSIGKLRSLRILWVKLLGDYSFDSLQPLSHCPDLIDLSLNGKIQKLSEYMDVHLKKLECLSLRNSQLEADPMPMLEKLPNLMFLELNNAHGQKKMICTGNGFPRLEILELIHLDELEEWQVEEGAMRMLRGLKIEPRGSNLIIPERLKQFLF